MGLDAYRTLLGALSCACVAEQLLGVCVANSDSILMLWPSPKDALEQGTHSKSCALESSAIASSKPAGPPHLLQYRAQLHLGLPEKQ